MSLLPIYYNSNRLTPKRRKKKKVSEKELKSIREHDKFLFKMGIYKKRKPLKSLKIERSEKSDSFSEKEKHISEYDWSPCVKKERPPLDGSFIIGQAYNKGNLVVLSKSESKETSTGKRR